MNYYAAHVFLFVIVRNQGMCLHFDTTPAEIQIGITEIFSVNCSVTEGSIPGITWLNSIVLSRPTLDKSGRKITLASINSITEQTHVYAHDAVAVGVIDNKGNSFLSITWSNPTNENVGEYTCEANGMDDTWRPVTVSDKVTAVVSLFNITALLNEVANLQKSVDDLTSLSNNLPHNVEKSKLWLFKRSEVYKGHRYYLSQQDPISRSEQSMATCVFYGGYLSEIDDEEEFNFTKTFIQQFSGFKLVLIGGTDEESEEVWKYRQSKKTVPQFLMRNRKLGNTCNCLYLYDEVDWRAVDDHCYYTSPPFPTRYLCEIPENTH